MALLNPVWLGKKNYAGKEDRRLIEAIFGQECVLGIPDMAASISAGNVMSIAAGKAVVDGDTNADQGFYLCTNDAAVTKTHVPDGTNPKVDRLVLTVNDSEAVGSGTDSASYDIIPGTPVSGASLSNPAHWPAVGNTQMMIARVLVPSGVGGIVSFTDERVVQALSSQRQGTEANKPAAAKFGRRYYATDSKIEYMDTGSVWIAIGTDPAINRIVRGVINADGTLNRGTGFTPAKTGTGTYTITYSTTFGTAPILIATSIDTNCVCLLAPDTSATVGNVQTILISTGANADKKFAFMAMVQ